MSQASVLIVGAGAMGTVLGYHLQLGGTAVTYLVRPGRAEAFRAPRALYCYDDHQLKRFDGYGLIEDAGSVDGQAYDYVLLTLDGATTRGAEASAMLRTLGRALAGSRTVLFIGGVGIGLREHVLQQTGLPPQRVLHAVLALLAHQNHAELPRHAPTDAALLAQAAIAYHHFPNRVSVLVDKTEPQVARAFAALYSRSGTSRCNAVPRALLDVMGTAAFPMLAASEIAGWPSVDGLVKQRELWHLSCRAQAEIAALPPHGWIGRLLGLLMTDGLSARIQRKVERDSLPLDYQAFNRFHHGGKVREQDTEVMRNCLAAGLAAGRPMPALQALLARLDAHRAAAG